MNVFRLRPSIVLFGDSITQQGFGVDGNVGWASLLASAYSRRADVLNRGFSGYNTMLAVDMLPRVFSGPIASSTKDETAAATTATPSLPASSALFCTIWFGANDAALPGELQHVPLSAYQENLKTIVRHIQSTFGNGGSGNEPPIVLITPPPFDAPAWMEFRQLSSPGRSNDVAQKYGDAVKTVAEQCNVAVLDAWTLLEGDSDQKTKYLSDGLHLNEQGNRKIYEGILATLSERYPHVLPLEEEEGKGIKVGVPLEEELWEQALEQRKSNAV